MDDETYEALKRVIETFNRVLPKLKYYPSGFDIKDISQIEGWIDETAKEHTDFTYGCDNCGESKPVSKAKQYFPMNKQWENVFLCDDCIKKVKKERWLSQ